MAVTQHIECSQQSARASTCSMYQLSLLLQCANWSISQSSPRDTNRERESERIRERERERAVGDIRCRFRRRFQLPLKMEPTNDWNEMKWTRWNPKPCWEWDNRERKKVTFTKYTSLGGLENSAEQTSERTISNGIQSRVVVVVVVSFASSFVRSYTDWHWRQRATYCDDKERELKERESYCYSCCCCCCDMDDAKRATNTISIKQILLSIVNHWPSS